MPTPSSPNALKELFAGIQHLPFLFVGSGLSRRYRGLPDWKGLLSHFAEKIHPGNPLALQLFTGAGAVPDLPAAASVIEKEFNKLWLAAPEYAVERERHKESVRAGISPFKIEVAAFFSRSNNITGDKTIEDELALLKNVSKRSVAGIITTNYDSLLESTFENYRTFIGQEPLLFGETQGVAEIYKIHGCCSRPDSLVLNAEDYLNFEARNAYLAAKLLTIFVDHPIIFLGYNLGDENIRSILESIIDCLGPANLGKLKQRLIFVEYTPDPLPEPVVASHSIQFQGSSRALELTKIRMNGFLPLYRVLQSKKYLYNPKLLEQLKRDIYHLATTNEKVDRFQIADIEDDAELSKVETLVGVGVIPADVPVVNGHGHNIPEPKDLFRDILFDDGGFELKSLVEHALGKLLKAHSHSLPIHKYIKAYRDETGEDAPLDVLKDQKTSIGDFLSIGLTRRRESCPIESIKELDSQSPTDGKKIELIPLLVDLEKHTDFLESYLRDFLCRHPDALEAENGSLKTNLKRVIKIYDFLKYGQGKGTHNTEEESIG